MTVLKKGDGDKKRAFILMRLYLYTVHLDSNQPAAIRRTPGVCES